MRIYTPIHGCWKTAVLLALFGSLGTPFGSFASSICSAQDSDLSALDGEWLYVEDRTEARATEDHGPPMSAKFPLRVEDDGVILVRPRGDETISLDGSTRQETKNGSTTTYRGQWKDGVLKYDIETVRDLDKQIVLTLRREFRVTPDGMLLRVVVGERDSLALYQHPKDIDLPEPAKASIDDMKWLTGAWVGTRRTSSIEERWSPPKGGAMLGVSRTVKGEKMTGFEFLRVTERGRSLVYTAQPGGRSPTEFVLTEPGSKRAVFVNPRHDYPQRIVYEVSDDGGLTTSIGFAKGGKLRSVTYTREDK